MKKERIGAFLVLMLLVGQQLCPWAQTAPVYAGAYFAPVTAEIPVAYTGKAEEMTVVLTGDDPGFPMPPEADEGEARLVLGGEKSQEGGTDRDLNSRSFGPIVFSRPGVYEYTVSGEGAGRAEARGEETPLYHIRIAVMNEGRACMTFAREGDRGKCSRMVFGSDGKENHAGPETGDDKYRPLGMLLFGTAGTGLLILLIRQGRRRQRT